MKVKIKSGRRDTRAARASQLENAAVRALDDPRQLARAARIVRAGLARGDLAIDDLEGDVVHDSDLVEAGSDSE